MQVQLQQVSIGNGRKRPTRYSRSDPPEYLTACCLCLIHRYNYSKIQSAMAEKAAQEAPARNTAANDVEIQPLKSPVRD